MKTLFKSFVFICMLNLLLGIAPLKAAESKPKGEAEWEKTVQATEKREAV